MALVASDAAVQGVKRKVVHDLAEDQFPECVPWNLLVFSKSIPAREGFSNFKSTTGNLSDNINYISCYLMIGSKRWESSYIEGKKHKE
jgi:hypothetical protein